MFGDIGGTLKSIMHHYSHFNYIFSGSDLVVCEGTSEGEHQDGSWRAGVPEHGAGRWCDVFEIRDWKDPALLHLSRSGLCRQGHGALSVAQEQVSAESPPANAERAKRPTARNNTREEIMKFDIAAMRRQVWSPLVAAVLGVALGAATGVAAQARDFNELLLKSVGTTRGRLAGDRSKPSSTRRWI